MGTGERRTRRRGHGNDRRAQCGNAAVRADENPLARGTNTTDGTIPLKAGSDVALAQITVDPGGSSGWHSHPGGAIVVVDGLEQR
jgi:quercetin dioxygenase-like cupin family protein